MAAIRIITLFVVLTALGVAPARGEFQCVGGPADGTLCGNEGTCGGALCVDISPPTPCDTCPALLVGSASGAPGDDVTITVTFRPGSVDVAGVQNDLRFDPSTPIVKCKVNPDINKGVTAFSFRRSAMRALVSGLDPDPIPEGPLYTCAAQIAEDTAPGTYPLRISNVRGATFNGLPVQTTGQDGAIVVRPPAAGATPLATRTPTPTSTPAPTIDSNGVATFAVNSAVGIAGDRVRLSVTYASTSYGAVGLQNDLVFAVPTLIAGNVGILPDCSMSTDLAASDSRFIFIPFHCVPGVDCWGIRAHIVRPANLDPAGSLLYTCSIQVAADAPPGRYPLRVENAVAGTDHAFQFATRGIDGEIAVIAPANSTPVSTWTPTATPTATPTVPPPITIEVGRATGMLGDDVTVDIVLRANGAVVSEVFSSINFTADTQIIDCTANADIGKIGGFHLRLHARHRLQPSGRPDHLTGGGQLNSRQCRPLHVHRAHRRHRGQRQLRTHRVRSRRCRLGEPIHPGRRDRRQYRSRRRPDTHADARIGRDRQCRPAGPPTGRRWEWPVGQCE